VGQTSVPVTANTYLKDSLLIIKGDSGDSYIEKSNLQGTGYAYSEFYGIEVADVEEGGTYYLHGVRGDVTSGIYMEETINGYVARNVLIDNSTASLSVYDYVQGEYVASGVMVTNGIYDVTYSFNGEITQTAVSGDFYLYYMDSTARGIAMEEIDEVYKAYEIVVDSSQRSQIKIYNAKLGEWCNVELMGSVGSVTDGVITLPVGVYDFSYNNETGMVSITESYEKSIREGYYVKGANGLGIGSLMTYDGENYVQSNLVVGGIKEGIYVYAKGVSINAVYDYDDLQAGSIGTRGTHGKIVLPQGIYDVTFNVASGKILIVSNSANVTGEVMEMVSVDMMRKFIHLPKDALAEGNVINIRYYRQISLMRAYGWMDYCIIDNIYIPESLSTGTIEDHYYGTFTKKADNLEIYAVTNEAYYLMLEINEQVIIVQRGA